MTSREADGDPKALWHRWLPNSYSELLQTVGLGFALVAALSTAREFDEHKHEARVEKTLALVKAFEEAPLWNAQREVAEIAAAAAAAIQAHPAPADLGPLTDQQRRTAAEAYVLESAQTASAPGVGRLRLAIVDVVGFFDSIELCIEADACDGRTAHSLLDDYASAFWRDFGPVIAAERQSGRRPRFAVAFERFSRSPGQRP